MPPANNINSRVVYKATHRPVNETIRQRINTKTAGPAEKALAGIMRGRAPRLTEGEVTESKPYEHWNQFREQARGRIIRGEEIDRFAGRSINPRTGRTEYFYTRPHVTYRTKYAKKNTAGGCKYGRYSDGDGKVYCLANPNHHKLANADHKKSQNAYMRRDIAPGYHQFRAQADAARGERSGIVLRIRRNRNR
jgi:hypothetical protein